jgi:hypothetical protein
MPYTPPTSRSPATSSPNSPILSRNHSYNSINGRPGLPRSRSATYLQKHRRTPSISDQHSHHDELHHGELAPIDPSQHIDNGHHHISHGSRTAASHVIEHADSLAVPELTQDSTVSPSEASDEDDRGRGRQVEILAAQLKQKMVLPKRTTSPSRQEDSQPAAPTSTPAALSVRPVSPALTAEARKISHSRSSSEIQLSKFADMPSQAASSGSGSDSEDDLCMKPPLLRKKSGELVKPALRASSHRRRPLSMPGTPTYGKAVHFNEEIEQVRHFLQVDRPIAVSAGSSPVESFDSESEYPFGPEDSYKPKSDNVEWEIRTANFPRDSVDRQYQVVRVEKIALSADNKTLVGTVACANIAFQKWVVARFTLDYWKTTSEVVCEFNNDVRKKQLNDGYDRFNFNIKLSDQAHLETKTMLICVRYNVAGQEHWDNNDTMNYQVDFIKKVVPRKSKQGRGAGTTGTIPRSRHSPLPRPRSFPATADDDFSSGFEFGANTTILRDPQVPTLRLKNRKGSMYPTQQKRGQSQQNGGAFATRYDFGASLSAALTQAQVSTETPGTGKKAIVKSGDYFSKPVKAAAPAVQPVAATSSGPINMSSQRPELGSREYHDLIQKFCYVR